MRLKDVKDMRDLRDIDSKEALELVDELGQIISQRGWELLKEGRTQARRALGAPQPATVAIALVGGFAVGIGIGAALAMFVTPVPGSDARRRLRERVDRIRESVPVITRSGNGRARYGPDQAASGTAAPTEAIPS